MFQRKINLGGPYVYMRHHFCCVAFVQTLLPSTSLSRASRCYSLVPGFGLCLFAVPPQFTKELFFHGAGTQHITEKKRRGRSSALHTQQTVSLLSLCLYSKSCGGVVVAIAVVVVVVITAGVVVSRQPSPSLCYCCALILIVDC